MTFRENGWLIGLVALALTGSMACQRQPDAPPGYGQTTERAEDQDTRITTSVQARFYTDDQVRGRQIEVHTEDSVVTLRGTVDSEQARQRAVELARDVDGVQRVEDNLHVGAPVATTGVDPVAPMAPRTDAPRTDAPRTDAAPTDAPRTDAPRADTAPDAPRAEAAERRDPDEHAVARRDETGSVNPTWITTTIQAQYFVTPGVAPWKVDVTTSAAGVVTLEGEVDTAEDRQRAVQIARETDGVTRVEDRLRIRGERDEPAGTAGVREADRPGGPADTPDAWVTTKVQSKYFLDDDVRGRNIDVTTSDGIVTLSGSVHSERERRQAVALARNTDGVRDVRDELTIQPAADADREPRPPDTERRDRTAAGQPAADRTDDRPIGERVEDGWITTKVQSKLYLEEDVRGRSIDVQTRDGVVTLRGQVESDAARKLAEQIARDTDGVRRVDNQIAVGTAAAGNDR